MEKNAFTFKVGSGLVTDGFGNIDEEFILSVCRQVSTIFRRGGAAFLVSSGAIASEPDKTMTENLRSVIGQPELMALYVRFFKIFGLKCGQLLITDNDLKSDVLKRVLLEAFDRGIVLVLNANDGTDDKEIAAKSKCADNDFLLKNTTLLIKERVRGAVIGFEKDGVIDDAGKVVHLARTVDREKILSYAKGGSPLGHGKNGAYTKFSVGFDLAEAGVPSVLAPGYKENFFLRAVKRYEGNWLYPFGTLFV